MQSIIANDYPKESLEVLVVDGMSSDGTAGTVAEYAARYPFIRLLCNPKKTAPTALNLGIAHARGAVLMRMDAHAEYPSDYIRSLVDLLHSSGADNVGGIWITRPANDSAMARAIAIGLSHPLGVGNARFRIGSSVPRWVDTVPFGCYRREVFERVGLFDEELVRNQDDELNLRLIKHGGHILLSPRVLSYYYARDSVGKLWRMYYQYGYFKPLVARKIGGVLTWRQLVPPIFVAAMLTSGLLALWSWSAVAVGALLLLCYLTAVAICAAATGWEDGWRIGVALLAVFPTIHWSYGLGYLRGAWQFLVRRRSIGKQEISSPISR
jgi:glycosyltransferase involved in cell wall biosynthesis